MIASSRLSRVREIRGPVLLAAVAALLTITAWPYSGAVSFRLDDSWRAALDLIPGAGLQFGRDIVFTYGPLGFLSVPEPFYAAPAALGFVATSAVYLAASVTVVWCLLRLVPWWAALPAAYVVVRYAVALPPFEMLQALVFAWSVVALARPPERDWRPFVVVAGLLAAIALLGKANVGVFCTAMLAITSAAIARPRWAGVAAFGMVGAVAALVLWLATGQSPANLPAFVTGSIEIIRGYAEAMNFETLARDRWTYGGFVLGTVVVGAVGYAASRAWPRDRRVGLVLLGVVLAFAEWKTAFTRNYVAYAFTTGLIALIALLAVLPPIRWSRRPSWAALAPIAAFAVLVVLVVVSPRLVRIRILDVGNPPRAWAAAARAAIVPGFRTFAIDRTRERIRSGVGLDGTLLDQLRGHRVEIEPWSTIAAAGYPEFAWAPLPVFQTYSAYTLQLDELNAARLRAADGPDRILRERLDDPDDGGPRAVDRRFSWFESPAAMVESVCRFDELAATDRWQVLGRTARSCGPAEPVATITARAGETVAVPAESRPDRLLVVRIHGLEPTLVDRLVSAIHRGDVWWIDLGAGRGVHRLVPGTAADGLLLSVPPSIAYSPRFAFGPPIRTLAVSVDAGRTSAVGPLTFEFLSLPLRVGSG